MIRQAERQRIAAELHDDTIQTMIATSFALARLARKYPDAEISEVDARIRSSVRALRQFVFELEPDVSGDDLGVALQSHVRRAIGTSQDIEVNVDNQLDRWPRGSALSLIFRNVREAAINAFRHGEASRIEIELRCDDGLIVTRVLDNGRGFNPDRAPGAGHLGLRYMSRRAEEQGGTFSIVSERGAGTAVTFTVPLDALARADQQPRTGPAAGRAS